MSSEAKKKGAFMDKLQEKLGPIADKMSENPCYVKNGLRV